jgi:hypothetical protein
VTKRYPISVLPIRFKSDVNKTSGGSIKDTMTGVATSIKEAMGFGDTYKEEMKQPYIRDMQHPDEPLKPMSDDPNKLDTFEHPLNGPLAPSNMKQEMPPRAREAKQWTDEKIENSKKWVQDSKDKVKEGAKSVGDKMKEKFNDMSSSAGETLKQARESIDDIKINLEEKPHEAQVLGKEESRKNANLNDTLKKEKEPSINPQDDRRRRFELKPEDKGIYSNQEKQSVSEAVKRTKYARGLAKDSFMAAKNQSKDQEHNQENIDLEKEIMSNDDPELKEVRKIKDFNEPNIVQNQHPKQDLMDVDTNILGKDNMADEQQKMNQLKYKDKDKDQYKTPFSHELNPTRPVLTEQHRAHQADKPKPRASDETFQEPFLHPSS